MGNSVEYAGLTPLQRAMLASVSHVDSTSIVDSDNHFLIDSLTKTISSQGGKKEFGRGSHNSDMITFECDRYIEGHDMSLCNVVRIHYLNGDKPGVYDVDDMTVKSDDTSKVMFTWIITSSVTASLGKIRFAIAFKCVQEDGTVTYSMPTKINEELSVFDTIDNSERIVQENVDIFEQWKQDLFDASEREIGESVAAYLAENPPVAGATEEQANQIQKNTNDIGELKGDLANETAKIGSEYDKKITSYQLGDMDATTSEIKITSAYGISESFVIENGIAIRVQNNSDKNIVWNPLILNVDGTFRFNGSARTVNSGESDEYVINTAYDKVAFRVRTAPSSNMTQETLDSIMSGVSVRYCDLYNSFHKSNNGEFHNTLIEKVNSLDGQVNCMDLDKISFAQTIQEFQGDNLTFALQSDTHYKYNNVDNRGGIQNFSKITKYLSCDFIGNLGDLIRGTELDTYEDSINDLSYMMLDYFINIGYGTPFLPVKGNHEDGSLFVYRSNNASENPTNYGLEHLVTDDKLYAKIFHNLKNAEFPNVKNPMYYYYDVRGYRVIVLNCIDITLSENKDGSMYGYGGWNDHNYGYGNEQLNWLSNVALNTDKKVIVFTHIPLLENLTSEKAKNSDVVIGLLDAFIHGTSYTIERTDSSQYPSPSAFPVSINAKFANSGNVIGVFCGHTHKEQCVDKNVENGILYPHINIKNGCANGKVYVVTNDKIIETDYVTKTVREFAI